MNMPLFSAIIKVFGANDRLGHYKGFLKLSLLAVVFKEV